MQVHGDIEYRHSTTCPFKPRHEVTVSIAQGLEPELGQAQASLPGDRESVTFNHLTNGSDSSLD